MKPNRDWRIEESGWPARSVLECGGKPSATLLWIWRMLSREPRNPNGIPSHTVIVLAALLLLSTVCARAQNYSIDWFSIDGGSGTSTGGVYSVSGTIGQPDAGTMSGGNYSLAGGFWGIISAIQTPGAPLLIIRLTQTNTVVVSWPSPSTGFSLQQNSDLNISNWSTPGENITDNGTNKFIIVSPPAGNRFYRLFKP
jgi:hypothetical protein